MKRKIVLLIADTHAGSEYGLTHPDTPLEKERQDGTVIQYHPSLNEIQKFLFYDVFEPAINEVIKFAGQDEVIVIHEGDPTQGIKFEPGSISEQLLIAVSNMTHLLQFPNVKTLRLIKSTSAHAFGEQSDADVLMCNILRRSFPDKSIATHYHGEYLIQEVDTLMDCSHHGPSRGNRIWLEGNQFRFYMRDILTRAALRKRRLPDIITRSHTHGKLEEHLTVEGHRCWGLITPPMQFPGAYVRQITRSVEDVEMGVLAIEIIQHSSGRKTVYPHWFTKSIHIPTKEIL